MWSRIDIRTLLIIMLVLLVLGMSIFGGGSGDSSSTIKDLIEKNEKANKELEKKDKELGKAIEKLKDSVFFYEQEYEANFKLIDSLNKEMDKKEAQIDKLKKSLSKIPREIQGLNDEQRLKLWKEYFKRKRP